MMKDRSGRDDSDKGINIRQREIEEAKGITRLRLNRTVKEGRYRQMKSKHEILNQMVDEMVVKSYVTKVDVKCSFRSLMEINKTLQRRAEG